MGVKIQTVTSYGLGGLLVDVECSISNGLPAIHIVGSANSVINESKERVRNAILSSGLLFPRRRISLNLAPADIPKYGTAMDLAIAVAILVVSEQISQPISKTLFIGELSLDGAVRPIRGIIGKLLAIPNLNEYTFCIPSANVAQAKEIENIRLVGVTNLEDVCNFIRGNRVTCDSDSMPVDSSNNHQEEPILIEHIAGQELAKRAVLIAAAGGHGLLLHGPPGTGKTMLAQSVNGILPPMGRSEILEVSHLHSMVNETFHTIIANRPFRSPHHTISYAALVGGGVPIKPGEISLAHRGVLFLDELPEFNRQAIETLRQPMENHQIAIARAGQNVTLPADFTLVATANPCPCGNYGTDSDCRCTAQQIVRYQNKLSGPLLDRIDLHVGVERVSYDSLLEAHQSGQTSESLRKLVHLGRKAQRKRYGTDEILNSTVPKKKLIDSCEMHSEAKILLRQAAEKLGLSARSYFAMIRIARTIADVESAVMINTSHMAEALQYRRRIQQS